MRVLSECRLRLAGALVFLVLGPVAAALAARPGEDRGSAAGRGTAFAEDPSPEEAPVPRLESAQVQLRHATSVRSAMRNVSADERRTARANAIRAYQAVRGYFPGSVPECAEASFRAAELLRANGEVGAALVELQWVRDQGGESPFRVRAMLEIGHVERRAKHYQASLSAYESVLTAAAASPRQKDDAALWVGTVYVQLERPDDARRVWQGVADRGEDPLDRVRAYDELACASVVKGDLEGAAGILERCRDALAAVAAEETKLGDRVRGALAGMRAHDELQRAVADRERTKQRKLERDGDS